MSRFYEWVIFAKQRTKHAKCVSGFATRAWCGAAYTALYVLQSRRPALIQALKELGDFYLKLKWDFHSWGLWVQHVVTCS